MCNTNPSFTVTLTDVSMDPSYGHVAGTIRVNDTDVEFAMDTDGLTEVRRAGSTTAVVPHWGFKFATECNVVGVPSAEIGKRVDEVASAAQRACFQVAADAIRANVAGVVAMVSA